MTIDWNIVMLSIGIAVGWTWNYITDRRGLIDDA